MMANHGSIAGLDRYVKILRCSGDRLPGRRLQEIQDYAKRIRSADLPWFQDQLQGRRRREE